MIEKKIHYCWFGKNEKPQSVILCINSWKKFLPDYEIIEWNETNFDIHCYPYVSEAYSQKKWAFVSDVARLKVVYENGGIYFDTDVEVIRSFDDLLNQNFFLGRESQDRVASGLGFGAEKNSPIIKAMLDIYNDKHYILPNGKRNPFVCPDFNTKALIDLGLKFTTGIINFKNGSIYPEEYFSPLSVKDGKLRITENTYSIHHYDNSWMSKSQHLKKSIKIRLDNRFTRYFLKLIKQYREKKNSI